VDDTVSKGVGDLKTRLTLAGWRHATQTGEHDNIYSEALEEIECLEAALAFTRKLYSTALVSESDNAHLAWDTIGAVVDFIEDNRSANPILNELLSILGPLCREVPA
jgi:hypothetical protein